MREDHLRDLFRKRSAPMNPEPCDVEVRLIPLPDVRCVLFDVYGTLVISGSGDVGTAGAVDQQTALDESLAACDITLPDKGILAADRITAVVREHHRRAKEEGVAYPEVDILEVWSEVLEGAGVRNADRETLKRLAIEYDARINPVWPMPGMEEVLRAIRDRNMIMGIVSNAQFYTPLMLSAFTGKPCADLGFKEEICVWSWQSREGKPSKNLYRKALSVLDEWGIRSSDVLYVGNDMRNDIWPSSELGCRTALFAGDRRSLRLREDDPNCRDVEPDIVLTALPQLLECLP